MFTLRSLCGPLEKVHSHTYSGNNETDVFTPESCCNLLDREYIHTHAGVVVEMNTFAQGGRFWTEPNHT